VSQQLDRANDQVVISRLLVRRQKMNGSQKCCDELAELTVGRNFGDWHAVVGEVPWSSVAKTVMNCHSKLVLHSLRNNQPVQVVMHQPRQTTLVFSSPCDQRCCSILNMLQLVHKVEYKIQPLQCLHVYLSGQQ